MPAAERHGSRQRGQATTPWGLRKVLNKSASGPERQGSAWSSLVRTRSDCRWRKRAPKSLKELGQVGTGHGYMRGQVVRVAEGGWALVVGPGGAVWGVAGGPAGVPAGGVRAAPGAGVGASPEVGG